MAKGFVLDSTSKSLQAFAATNSAQVDYVVKWADTTSTTFTEGSSDGQITSTTAADITPAPASNVKRVINGLTLYNRGSAAEAITLAYKNSSSSRYITRIVLTAGQAWSLDDMTTISATTTPVTLVSTYRNLLMNGNFQIAQRSKNYSSSLPSFSASTTFTTAHTNYTFDRWFLLRQLTTGTLNVTQASTFFETATGGVNDLSSGTGVKLAVNAVNKFGIAQMIENKNCAHLAGQSVTLSFRAKAISTISGVGNLTSINFAIISYNGATADAISRSTIINTAAWNATGTNPTLGTGYSYVRDDSKSLSTDWQTFSTTAQLPSSFKNIGVMIWSNSTTNATGDNLLITDVQLEPGLTATSFEVIPQSVTEDLCKRYFLIYYATSGAMAYPGTGSWSGNNFDHTFTLTVPLRVPPTFLGTSPSTFKTNFFKNFTFTGTSLVTLTIRADSITLRAVRNTALSPVGSSAPIGSDVLADAGTTGTSYISFNSEL